MLFSDIIILPLMTVYLSFYGSKMILDRPNHFGRLPIVLDWSNLFWSGPNHFGNIQIIKIIPEKFDLNLTKMVWIQPEQLAPDQNNLDGPKPFRTHKPFHWYMNSDG